ncbi:MAG: hypothetical protein HKM04_03600 [Legionellales bacterium]|nr:hypothetical protein [Legionellales bacterium]
MKNSLLVGALLCGLSACSSVTHSSYAQKAGLFPDRDALYLQEKSVPSLQIPNGVAPIPNDPYYVIPSTPNQGGSTVSLLPPGSLAAQNQGK